MTVTHLRSADSPGADHPSHPTAAGHGRTSRGFVVIADRIPTFSAGMAAVLEYEGFAVERTSDPLARLRRQRADVALVTADDVGSLRALCDEFPGLAVVAVLVSADPADYIRALRDGAHAVVAWCASQTEIVQVVVAAMAGQTVLPRAVAQAIALAAPNQRMHCDLSAVEIRWLRGLASGISVVLLAKAENFSQREVFRRLADLYHKMGARNRQEAIALAGQWGLLVDGGGRADLAG